LERKKIAATAKGQMGAGKNGKNVEQRFEEKNRKKKKIEKKNKWLKFESVCSE